MSNKIAIFTLLSLSIIMSGCIGTAVYIKDYLILAGADRAVNYLKLSYLGTSGPDSVIVRNKDGVRAKLNFESGHFPKASEISDLNLKESDWNEISLRAEDSLRDFLGEAKVADFIILNKETDHEYPKAYLLDIKLEDEADSALEHQVRRGFLILNKDLIINARLKRLFSLQRNAMRSRLGVWRHITSTNPSWHD